MKVYISADIEGIASISHWDEAGKQAPTIHTAAISEGCGAPPLASRRLRMNQDRPSSTAALGSPRRNLRRSLTLQSRQSSPSISQRG